MQEDKTLHRRRHSDIVHRSILDTTTDGYWLTDLNKHLISPPVVLS